MVKLIYLYIQDIQRNIKNQEITFSNNFKVEFDDGILKIFRTENKGDFWGEKVRNSTLLLGKNGVGKTSLIDLIGLNDKSKKKLYDKARYFMVYHIKDNLFYFEGTIVNKIKNLKMYNLPSKSEFYFSVNTEGEIFLKIPNVPPKINIYYARNKIAIPWAGEKKISKENKSNAIKYYYKTATFEDAYITYSQFDLFYNERRTFKIEQKMGYNNQPKYLSYLYEIERENLEKNSNNSLFLNEAGIKKNNVVYEKYIRKEQDRKYDVEDTRKEYFILRCLEKLVVANLTHFLEEEKYFNIDEKFSMVYKMKLIKEEYFYENENTQNIKGKIKYLEKLLNEVFLNFRKSNGRKNSLNVEKLIDYLGSIPSEFYQDKNFINIPGHVDNVAGVLNNLRKNYSDIFKFSFTNFSDGELVYLNLFATINKFIEDSKDNDCILLLDEPDINLHPEWSRKLIFDILRLIETRKYFGEVQIIIASHSPFIATDFPKENIYAFKKEYPDKSNSSNVIVNPEFGFAANIYDLISDTFFMNATIGEFAISKIRGIQKGKDNFDAVEIISKIDDVFLKNIMAKRISENDKN